MITPKWLLTKCQPIGISDVILFLSRCMLNEKTFDKNFDNKREVYTKEPKCLSIKA